MAPSTAIVWFRRDLRVHDHPALIAAAESFDRVVPLFVLDPRLLHGRFASPVRTWFLLESLRELAGRLAAAGAPLLIRTGDPAGYTQRLANAGIPQFRHPGSNHTYFSAPGGQVFRLLDVSYVGP